jgi:hypothetical protein
MKPNLRNSLFQTTLAVLLLAAAIGSRASQEGTLPLTSFRLESNGKGSSGRIVLEGKQNEKAEIVSLKIGAFGKNYTVPPEKLRQLADLHANGVRISYEEGYKELGGRTVHIQFQVGFTSSTEQKALITITEDGKIEVGGIQNEKPAAEAAPADASRPGHMAANRPSSAPPLRLSDS